MSALAWTVARRFRKSKKNRGFTSFISSSSTVGIALGCAVLIVMLSIMNGFERELSQKLLSVIPHGELKAVESTGMKNWQRLVAEFEQDPMVTLVQPYAKVTALLQRGKRSKAADLTAISPQYSANSPIIKLIPQGVWQVFSTTPDALILGKTVAEKLEIKVGDKVQVLLPQPSTKLKLQAPKSAWFTLVGVVQMGGEIDNFLGLMQLDKAAQLLNVETGAQGIQFYFTDPFFAPLKVRTFGYQLQQHAYLSDWTRTQGHLYQDIQLVRIVVYIALTLVIAVACFNIVSSLVMAVNERKPEIAMLKTMGATSGLIVRIFMLQGLINGIIGTLSGCIIGVLLASNVSDIARFMEQLFGVSLLSGDIYFIDFLPSMLRTDDVVVTVVIAFFLSLAATIYPALKASKIEPAKVLGH